MAKGKTDDWFWHLGADLQRLSEELMRARPSIAVHTGWQPRCDVLEDNDKIEVRAEIAGVRGEEIVLRYSPSRHRLVITGVRREEDYDGQPSSWSQLEIPYGPFSRELDLPPRDIDPGDVRASYSNGILTVWLPKKNETVLTTIIVSTDL
ncbi:MAG: Hsp20/alpha crystallin family protein [Armatimonadetes bacterium]|nr:Hsp20/alpha crystallin family protein [Armatimonadota bacterium]